MLNASVEIIINSLQIVQNWPRLQIVHEERGWEFQDITNENLRQFSALDLEIS
jgi:hypothetical protein